MEQTDELWSRFEKAVERCTDVGLSVFRPPATPEQISAAERVLGLTFPEQLRYAYRKHDGATAVLPGPGPRQLRFDLFPGDWWCSLEELVDTWRFQVGAVERARADDQEAIEGFPPYSASWDDLEIRPEWFNRFWTPLGIDGMPHYYIDMAPAPRGKIGQLIAMDEMGGTESVVIAPSLFDWIAFATQALESGRFRKGPSGVWEDRDQNAFRYVPAP